MSGASIKGSDDKARFVLKSLYDTEKNMANFKKALDSLLKTEEKLRGKRLKLALALKGFSESEQPNLRKALLNTAESVVDMEEYRKYMHDRIESKTSEPLKMYKVLCKSLRDDVKNRDTAVEKEQKKRLDLDNATIKDSGNRAKITKSQLDLDNASTELSSVHTSFSANVERFQSKKTNDMRTVLFELIYSEMQYHSKSLEILSNLQNGIFAMDLDGDVAEVRDRVSQQINTPTSTLTRGSQQL
eukprot:Partr_v1_DN24742_c0_g1_i3_m37294 putative family with sequence similarity 92, member A1